LRCILTPSQEENHPLSCNHHLPVPQSWPSPWATPSRLSCVMWRRRRFSTCSRWRTPCPACTGWRWWRRAGRHHKPQSFHDIKTHYVLIRYIGCYYTLIEAGPVTPGPCLPVSSVPSTTLKTNPNFFFLNYQRFQKGNCTTIHTEY